MRKLTTEEIKSVSGSISDKGLTAANAVDWDVPASTAIIAKNVSGSVGHAISTILNPWGGGSLADALNGAGKISSGFTPMGMNGTYYSGGSKSK